jgi:hypothetical protein
MVSLSLYGFFMGRSAGYGEAQFEELKRRRRAAEKKQREQNRWEP